MRPAEATSVEAADVHKRGRLAGQLRRGSGGTSFAYDVDYLAGGGEAVATTLPVRQEAYFTPAGAVPAFFAGLLPEGVRLNAVIAAVKTSPDDELSILLAVGGDAVGDVTVVPEGEVPDEPTQPRFQRPGEVSFTELFAESIDPTGDSLDRAVPGVQEKLSHAVVSFPLRGARGPAILKLSPPAYPLLVENEAFCLGVAARAGMAVPRFEVVKDREGRSGLLVERFDRITDGGEVRRIHQEDACQVLGRWPSDKYRVTISQIASRLGEVVSAPQAMIIDLIERTALSWILGDGDFHAKNYSVRWLETERLVVPTPVYDVVTTIPYPLDQRMALSIDGRDDNLRGRFFVEFGARFGVPATLLTRRLGSLADGAGAAISDVHEIGFAEPTSDRLLAEMRRRCEAVLRFD